jgi:Domain of unknown function (DUF6316)
MTKMHFHPNRLFYQSGEEGVMAGWYFETREGTPRGPFPSREKAHTALDDYLTEHVDDRNDRSHS